MYGEKIIIGSTLINYRRLMSDSQNTRKILLLSVSSRSELKRMVSLSMYGEKIIIGSTLINYRRLMSDSQNTRKILLLSVSSRSELKRMVSLC